MLQKRESFIGLDLGGTFLKYALGTADGKIFFKGKKPSHGDSTKDMIFATLFAAIDESLAKAEELGLTVVGVGIGSPGAVDFDHGKLLGNTPNLPEWGDADIRSRISKQYGLPLWADNDANVMALAECRQGAAKGHKCVIALTLGTGIGGGIVINNQLFRGSRYAGAELGHMSIKYDGIPCACGGIGCIEAYASAPAMVRNYIEKLKQAGKPISGEIRTEHIFDKARQAETQALDVIDETCTYLGAALASFVNIFNPEIIVVGGGVADAGEEFLARIWKAMEERAMKTPLQGLKLVRAQLGNDAGMIGAISLAADAYKANHTK